MLIFRSCDTFWIDNYFILISKCIFTGQVRFMPLCLISFIMMYVNYFNICSLNKLSWISFLNSIHELRALLLGIFPPSEWSIGWAVRSGFIKKLYCKFYSLEVGGLCKTWCALAMFVPPAVHAALMGFKAGSRRWTICYFAFCCFCWVGRSIIRMLLLVISQAHVMNRESDCSTIKALLSAHGAGYIYHTICGILTKRFWFNV